MFKKLQVALQSICDFIDEAFRPIYGECTACGFDEFLDENGLCDSCFVDSLEEEQSGRQ